jgi:hypothetical protein
MMQVRARRTYLVPYSGTPIIVAVCARKINRAYPGTAIVIIIAMIRNAVISFYLGQIIIVIAIISRDIFIVINRGFFNYHRAWGINTVYRYV